MKRRITVGLVAAVAALGVAGCGGDDDDDNGSDDETTEETTTETGATGDEGTDTGADLGTDTTAPEGTEAVNDVIVQGLTASGEYSQGEAECVADLLSAEFADADLTEFQDPAFLEDLASDYESEIQECEGQ